MDHKNKKQPKNGKGSNWRGLLSLVSWALLLTVIFSAGSDFMTGQARHAGSVELEYGDYRTMVKADKVAAVGFDNEENILIITPADGYTYTDDNGHRYVYNAEEKGYLTYTLNKDTG